MCRRSHSREGHSLTGFCGVIAHRWRARTRLMTSGPGLFGSFGEGLGEANEGARRRARAPLGGVTVGLPLVERRSGDVQVRPLDSVRDELLEEDSGAEHAAPALPRDV